jgi:hypothetical protein
VYNREEKYSFKLISNDPLKISKAPE